MKAIVTVADFKRLLLSRSGLSMLVNSSLVTQLEVLCQVNFFYRYLSCFLSGVWVHKYGCSLRLPIDSCSIPVEGLIREK